MITTCTRCGSLYVAGSEEQAYERERWCAKCSGINGAQLQAYSVSWEAPGQPRGGFSSGSRRVYASSEGDAVVRCRQLVAGDFGFPEGNVRVTDVRPIASSIVVP